MACDDEEAGDAAKTLEQFSVLIAVCLALSWEKQTSAHLISRPQAVDGLEFHDTISA